MLTALLSAASDEQLEDACNAAERSIMSQIYIYAFYPHREADLHRDM